MTGDTITELQALLNRLREGDAAARAELWRRVHDRFRRLTAVLFRRDFPALRHDVDSVVHDAWIRLDRALDATVPGTSVDFFRLAAHKVRQVLLDLVRAQRRRDARERPAGADGTPAEGASPDNDDPERLARWAEFHERVETLPDAERVVFELHFYCGLKQAEIAPEMGLSPRQVSYLWVAATEKLADVLPSDGPGEPGTSATRPDESPGH